MPPARRSTPRGPRAARPSVEQLREAIRISRDLYSWYSSAVPNVHYVKDTKEYVRRQRRAARRDKIWGASLRVRDGLDRALKKLATPEPPKAKGWRRWEWLRRRR